MTNRVLITVFTLLHFTFSHPRAALADMAAQPEPEIDVIEHLGETLPLGIEFTDDKGERGKLGDHFGRGRPVVVSLVYYECPTLCSLISRALVRSMRSLTLELGRDYDALTISFDPSDSPRAASEKRRGYLEAMDRDAADPVWPFLTGNADSIRQITDALGFRYSPVPGSRDLAHAAVVFIVSPDGVLSRYLYGVDFPVRDLRLALVEASAGKVGTTIDRVLLRCYRYDPASRRYALFISTYLRTGGVVILLIVGGVLYRMWRRELRRATKTEAASTIEIPP